MEQGVQLYVYDMTKGLAAQLSPMFLGKRIILPFGQKKKNSASKLINRKTD